MSRTVLLIALGAAAGYGLGFRDARTHDRTVGERVLDRAGGSARGKYNPDVDGAVEQEAAARR